MPKSSSPSATIFISNLSTMADGEPHHGYQLTPELIGLLGVAAGAIIVTTYQLLVIHFCCRQMREENNIQHEQRRQWHDVNRNFRSTSARSVNSPSYDKLIPVLKYTKECSEGTCAVCLCEFTDGEEIRVLPECAHLFHVGCIDMWLSSHSNCRNVHTCFMWGALTCGSAHTLTAHFVELILLLNEHRNTLFLLRKMLRLLLRRMLCLHHML
ncbi:RING-H2 finger protein ATL51-like [Malus sylvestris]|uniref:RING-H2 finger protein ATL51-like n=1 Tax=Malus sylvestris TaxID=3752 RepID=UPI0021AC22B4|nr:RING-H2 finger protein ATL51-like [Malus sylvestris]